VIDGARLVAWLEQAGVTHLVWLPDSEIGQWEPALRASERVRLVRVCREGEAMAIAAGLWLGGASPVVAIQCTGFFEAGDAFRNVVFDLGVPLFLIIGYRNYAARQRPDGDSAARFLEPVLRAWGLPYIVIDEGNALDRLMEFYGQQRRTARPGAALLAEHRL